MNRFRVTTAIVIAVSLITLTACGGEDTSTTPESSPSVSAAPSSAPSSAAAAAAATSDKDLCESAEKAGQELKAAIIAAVMKTDEDPSLTEVKGILTALQEKVTTMASTGADGAVVTALKQFGAEVAKAAAAADPASALDNPAATKAGADLNAACKAAGVDTNF